VEITASASDNDVVDRVEFWYHIDQRGTLGPTLAMDPPTYIGDDQARPYQINWSVPKMCNAIVAIYVWAYDRCGNGGRSSTVQVKVCN